MRTRAALKEEREGEREREREKEIERQSKIQRNTSPTAVVVSQRTGKLNMHTHACTDIIAFAFCGALRRVVSRCVAMLFNDVVSTFLLKCFVRAQGTLTQHNR